MFPNKPTNPPPTQPTYPFLRQESGLTASNVKILTIKDNISVVWFIYAVLLSKRGRRECEGDAGHTHKGTLAHGLLKSPRQRHTVSKLILLWHTRFRHTTAPPLQQALVRLMVFKKHFLSQHHNHYHYHYHSRWERSQYGLSRRALQVDWARRRPARYDSGLTNPPTI